VSLVIVELRAAKASKRESKRRVGIFPENTNPLSVDDQKIIK
jgi:hypothetical protein